MPRLSGNVKEKDVKIHYIYKIHFLCGYPTGRYYLGKHTGKVNDLYAGSGNFCNAYYKKYGKIPGKTYIKEILEINPSKKINNDREKYIIGDLWKTDKLCMNQKPGGEGGCGPGKFSTRFGEKMSEETKLKISLANKNRKTLNVDQFDLNGNFIKRFKSAKIAAKEIGLKNCSAIQSACNKRDHYRTAGGFFWRWSNDCDRNFQTFKEALAIQKEKRNEIKKKQKEQEKQIKEQQKEESRQKIDQYSLDGKFIKTHSSILKVCKELNTKSWPAIFNCCRKKPNYKTSFGYIWRFHGDIPPKSSDKFPSNHRQVLQLDLDGNIIKTWNMISEAEKSLGINHTAIIRCCKNASKTAGGFKWKYIENE